VPYEECSLPLLSFNTYSTARERLESWIEEHELCLRYCGLTGAEAECFNHQIMKCRGICAGNEIIEEYNRRATQVLKKHAFLDKCFVIFDKGRSSAEQALILVENFRFAGYGYIDIQEQVHT